MRSPRRSAARAGRMSRAVRRRPCRPWCRTSVPSRRRRPYGDPRWPRYRRLVFTPPARNYSPWSQWMLRLAATGHVDPMPERDPTTLVRGLAWSAAGTARRELLGAVADPVPLDLEVLEAVRADGYRPATVVFDSEDTMSVPAYLLVPDERVGPPGPAVLASHGHGPGKSVVRARDDGGAERRLRPPAGPARLRRARPGPALLRRAPGLEPPRPLRLRHQPGPRRDGRREPAGPEPVGPAPLPRRPRRAPTRRPGPHRQVRPLLRRAR